MNKNIMKETIIKKAAKIIRKQGYLAASLRDLAKEVGIKEGSIYYHFPSKQSILLSIINETMEELLEGIKCAIEPGKSPLENLRNAMIFTALYHMKNGDKAYVSDNELKNLEKKNLQKIIGMRDQFQKYFYNLLKSGKESGVFIVDDLSIAAIAILTLCSNVVVWYRKNGRLSANEVAEKYADLILNGVSKS